MKEKGSTRVFLAVWSRKLLKSVQKEEYFEELQMNQYKVA